MQIYHYDAKKKQVFLAVKVKAGAKINEIGKFVIINGKQYLKISIKALLEDGKANKAIVSFLATEWDINQDNLAILTGHKNNFKILALKNLELDYLNLILSSYINK